MRLCGQQPSDEQLQLIQEKVRYWRKVGNEARVQSMSRLEDAAKQLVVLTALSDLRKQLAALATSLPGAWFLLIFFLPIPFWLLSLSSATQVFVPQLRPGVNIHDLDVDA